VTVPRDPEPTELDQRDLEVLQLLAEGKTRREVAAKLGVSDYTVSTHIRRIYAKLGARHTTHAVHLCHRAGLL